ncbi:MAG: hypothetical protein LBQ31_10885 [Bacteroidales bacterium]|nr:hypothetical protein [Bacteroidales bacterium]
MKKKHEFIAYAMYNGGFPILTGKVAEKFAKREDVANRKIREAIKNGTYQLITPDEKRSLDKILKRSKWK